MVPIYKVGDRSLETNYRPVSYTSVICKKIEHVLAGYLKQVWDTNKLLNESQQRFRPEYMCGIQIVRGCQDIADTLDEGARIDAIIIDFLKDFDLVSYDWLLTNIVASGVDSMVVIWVRKFLLGRLQRFSVGGRYMRKSQQRQGYRK